VTGCARVGHLQSLSLGRRDEAEGVRVNVDVRNGLLDFRHVAAGALISRGAGRMVSVPFHVRNSRAIGRCRPVALQTEHRGRPQKIGIIFRAMNIMATETGHPARVHDAGNEIIPLHAVSVPRAVRKVRIIRSVCVTVIEVPELL